MAVFTDVSPDDARALIATLDIGSLTSLRGIKAGIENSNYFLDTDRGHWVLTVFERLSFDELPFYLALMHHLAERGLPVPRPQARQRSTVTPGRSHDDGSLAAPHPQEALLHALHGKPCAVVNRLSGAHVMAPVEHHCAQVGAMLARMHLQARDLPLTQPNLRGLAWWTDVVPLITPFLTTAQCRCITDELAYQQSVAASPGARALPRGPVHGDLFRDNAMFEGDPGFEQLTGVFDFYFAGVDTFIFDMAICINDWCIDLDTGALVTSRAEALVAAYHSVRRLDDNEHRMLPAALRAAALRFWTSRLWDLHLPRDAKLLQAHDPAHFERVLHARIHHPWPA